MRTVVPCVITGVVWGTGTPKDRDEVKKLIDERFASAMGECLIVTLKVCRLYSK